jgi:predicted dithiol-disulfide oxidoreductase (DUF899 family)
LIEDPVLKSGQAPTERAHSAVTNHGPRLPTQPGSEFAQKPNHNCPEGGGSFVGSLNCKKNPSTRIKGTLAMATRSKDRPRVVSPDEWLVARKKLLAKEKQLTRQRDAVNSVRRDLPWTKVDKQYVFDGPNGKETLADLFAGRSQLIVYHFMFGPDWNEGCPSCSFNMDHTDGALVHLAQRDVTFVAISRAPISKIAPFKKRMGWRFRWVSSYGIDFNYDYHVSFTKDEMTKGKVYYNFDLNEFPSEEAPGISVFYKDSSGDIFHTYSSYARGTETALGTYNYLDLVPKGRDEDGLAFTMSWVRHHDRYDDGYLADPTKPYWPANAASDS